MKNEDKFNLIKDDYLDIFEKTNGYKLHELYYINGWVHLRTRK